MERLETLFWEALQWAVVMVDTMGPGQLLALTLACFALAYGSGVWRQHRLNRWLTRNPDGLAPVTLTEASVSILFPLAWTYRGLMFGTRLIRGRLLQAEPATEPQAGEEPDPSATPLRSATLGPSFFGAGLLCGALYWGTRLVEPALALAWDVSPGHSFWQARLLGFRRELVWLLPLSDHPGAAFFLILAFWMVIWWTLGNALRGLVFRNELRRNYGSTGRRELVDVLPSWRTVFGVQDLAAPSLSYRNWGTWIVAAGLVLLGVSSTTLGGEGTTVAPGDLAIALVLLVSWTLHLRLRGLDVAAPDPGAAEATADPTEAPSGWPEVLHELECRHGCRTPEALFERPLGIEDFSRPVGGEPTLSPLIRELGPYDADLLDPLAEMKLNPMQAKVLTDLSELSYVHLPAPQSGDGLRIAAVGEHAAEQREHLKPRHQVVLAPEGAGKSTLGILAAVNGALVHSRASLLITRSEQQAKLLAQRIEAMVQHSTLRWNLRLRRVGRDFASDLSRDIIPDLVVVSLHQLVTSLLDNAEVYRPFLTQVGMIVIEDVESFAGAVEIHAQLAFSRLHLLFRQLSEVEQLGETNAPLLLILGSQSMHQTGTWARGLCGVEAAVRSFSAERPGAEDTAAAGRQQVYRLADLRTPGSSAPTVQDVVAACEATAAPWHYRTCGDGRRHRGAGPLFLRQEPSYCQAQADQATVLILEGRWSEIHRELARLPFAGRRTGVSEVAILIDISPHEEPACSALVEDWGLHPSQGTQPGSDLSQRLVALPVPILRPPSTLAIQNHLLADLLQRWVEVGDLVRTFKAPIAGRLRHLHAQNMLYTDERKDVKPELKLFETKVFVRAPAGAIEAEDIQPSTDSVEELNAYDKVRQVESVGPCTVAVRNRIDHRDLRRVEADSAGLIYYPGRIFEDSRGRFVVVGRSKNRHEVGAIEVEPYLRGDVSSPRRRFDIQAAPLNDLTFQLFEPEPVLLGQDPIAVGLQAFRISVTTLATYRLDPATGLAHSREFHSAETLARFQPSPLTTIALVLMPNPELLAESAPRLRLGEARLLAALLRFLMPLVYRDTRHQVEVGLKVQPVGPEDEDEAAGRRDRELGPQDFLCLFDLHHGGNGISRSVFREGLSLLLRLCRHFLGHIEDLERLARLYDHEGDRRQILQDNTFAAEVDGERTPMAPVASPDLGESAGENEADQTSGSGELPLRHAMEDERDGLLRWLDSRLLAESVVDASRPEPSSEASNDDDQTTDRDGEEP